MLKSSLVVVLLIRNAAKGIYLFQVDKLYLKPKPGINSLFKFLTVCPALGVRCESGATPVAKHPEGGVRGRNNPDSIRGNLRHARKPEGVPECAVARRKTLMVNCTRARDHQGH